MELLDTMFMFDAGFPADTRDLRLNLNTSDNGPQGDGRPMETYSAYTEAKRRSFELTGRDQTPNRQKGLIKATSGVGKSVQTVDKREFSTSLWR